MRKRRKPPAKDEITQAILRCMEVLGLRDKDIYRRVGWGSDLFSRKMSGDRKWSWKDVKLITPILGLAQPWDLFIEPVKLRMVRISAQEKFDYREVKQTCEIVEIRLEGDKDTLLNTYCLLLQDRSLMPGYRKGTRFLARTESWDEIEDDDLVVYVDQASMGQIFRISIKTDQIILKSLNPSIEDILLPKQHIRLCDRIFRAEF